MVKTSTFSLLKKATLIKGCLSISGCWCYTLYLRMVPSSVKSVAHAVSFFTVRPVVQMSDTQLLGCMLV